MKNIAFLTYAKDPGFSADDELLARELQSHFDIQVTPIPWDQKCDWKKFDLVLVRSTWDYTHHLDKFLNVIREIEQQTNLLNSYKLILWNSHKHYLKELQNQGVQIVPTQFFSSSDSLQIPAQWHEELFIIKPCISASAYKTMIISRADIISRAYQKELHSGDWMLQPFLPQIKQGEISLHYFNGKFSHAINKVPKSGDFRVQLEHGADLQLYEASAEILRCGEKIVSNIPHEYLYARVDLVPYQNSFVLMELELIEPALYFRTDPSSVKNFSHALEKALYE